MGKLGQGCGLGMPSWVPNPINLKKQFAHHRGTEKTRVWGEPLSHPMGEPGNSDFSFNFQLCVSVVDCRFWDQCRG